MAMASEEQQHMKKRKELGHESRRQIPVQQQQDAMGAEGQQKDKGLPDFFHLLLSHLFLRYIFQCLCSKEGVSPFYLSSFVILSGGNESCLYLHFHLKTCLVFSSLSCLSICFFWIMTTRERKSVGNLQTIGVQSIGQK